MTRRPGQDEEHESPQFERFIPVTDPDLVKRSGFGRLVAHQRTPRFIASVDVKKPSLRILEAMDDLHAWSASHASEGQNPQAPLFALFSEAIKWVQSNPEKFASRAEIVWAPLPESAFSGRAATREDLEAGAAYFVLEGGHPLDIAIPQYACTFDDETNEPVPCVILQAEGEPRGDKVVAYLDLRDNEAKLGYFDRFILLGEKNPEIQPSKLATPAYRTLSSAVKNLSGLVSAERTLADKRSYLRDNRGLIGDLLTQGLAHCSPIEFFALLDGVKSLASRDIALKKRAVAMGLPQPDVMLHAIDVEQTCSLLGDDPQTCVFSLYQTPADEFYGFLLFVEGGEVRARRFDIATGPSGKNTAEQLRVLIGQRMWEVPRQTEHVMFPLLELFGSSLIPHLMKLGGRRKLILVPHRWTHILPLHMMAYPSGDGAIALDDVVTSTTYASSLTSFQWSRASALAAVRPEHARLALLCVDTNNLGNGADFELRAYRNMFADARRVDIVTSAVHIPSDLSLYPIILWSSHGVSDPTGWERGRLLFEREVFSADRIVREWDHHVRDRFGGL